MDEFWARFSGPQFEPDPILGGNTSSNEILKYEKIG